MSLPVRYDNEPDDPLEADSTEEAVGVWEQQGLLLALGDEAREEWIRFDPQGGQA